MRPKRAFCLILAFAVALVIPRLVLTQSEPEQPQTQTVEEVEMRVNPLAAILTVINIPARAGLCVANGVLGSIVMGASAGRRSADAAQMIETGCSGPWVVTPEMLDEARSKQKGAEHKGSPGDKRP